MALFDRIRPESLELIVDGSKKITIKAPSKRNGELNESLADPAKFAEFARNPKQFASQFDIAIDRKVAEQLALRLRNVRSLDELQSLQNSINARFSTTVWAICSGSYSVATAKIAVAF